MPAEKDIKIKPLTTKVLDQISAYLLKSGLEEIEIKQGDSAVRLKRPGAAPAASHASPAQITEVKEKKTVNAFTSPMIGTFYRSASPEAQPFVKEGDSVKV